MARRCLSCVVAAGAILGALATTAAAESTAAVLATADTDNALAGRLTERVRARLGAADYQVRDVDALDETAAGALRRCPDPSACLPSEAYALVGLVVLFAAQADAERTVLTVWLFDGEVGRRLRVDRRFCESCDADKLGATFDELLDESLAALGERTGGETLIAVRTEPAGCTVAIDGQVVGLSGRAYNVPAKAISVRVEMDGYEPQTRTIDMEPGEKRQVEFVLSRVDRDEPGGRNWLLIGGLGGTGVAALGLGVTWMVIDGDRFDDGRRLRQRRKSFVPGVITTGIGAAMVAGAAIVWWRGDTAAGHAITVGPVEDGVSIGLGGVF